MARKGKKAAAGELADGTAGEGRRQLLLADHPRAVHQIRTIRAYAALGLFLVVAYFSHKAGQPLETMLTRALEAGVAGYLLGWFGAVMLWRQLAQAEIESARKKIVAALLEMEVAERKGEPA
jgi:hypothetical protein